MEGGSMAQREVYGEPAVLRALHAPWDLVQQPTHPGHLIRLEKEQTLLGRSPDCDVVIPIISVSRSHCRIVREGTGYVLEDLQSRNGTFLNSQLTHGAVLLRAGDRIGLQDAVLSFERPFDKSL